jgi:hypothetical protein
MHIKISTSASITLVKYMHYDAVSKTEELICESDERSVLDYSDTEAADDLSEDFDNSVPRDQLWCDRRSEDRAKIHNFCVPNSINSMEQSPS